MINGWFDNKVISQLCLTLLRIKIWIDCKIGLKLRLRQCNCSLPFTNWVHSFLPTSSVTKLNWTPDFIELSCKVFLWRHREEVRLSRCRCSCSRMGSPWPWPLGLPEWSGSSSLRHGRCSERSGRPHHGAAGRHWLPDLGPFTFKCICQLGTPRIRTSVTCDSEKMTETSKIFCHASALSANLWVVWLSINIEGDPIFVRYSYLIAILKSYIENIILIEILF